MVGNINTSKAGKILHLDTNMSLINILFGHIPQIRNVLQKYLINYQ